MLLAVYWKVWTLHAIILFKNFSIHHYHHHLHHYHHFFTFRKLHYGPMVHRHNLREASIFLCKRDLNLHHLPLRHLGPEEANVLIEELLLRILETKEISYNWLFLWWLLEFEQFQNILDATGTSTSMEAPQRQSTKETSYIPPEKHLEDRNGSFNHCPYVSNRK